MLNLIGLGLGDEKDISLNALEAVRRSNSIYLESYTSRIGASVADLEKLYGKKIILADRDTVEKHAEETILKDALHHEVSFLVVGDIFGATTHADLVLRAKNKGIKINYYHNASIINAVGVTGLELYKFGKVASMPFFEQGFRPETTYDTIAMNLKNRLHTLVLLDIKAKEPSRENLRRGLNTPEKPRYMTIKECLSQLLEIERERKRGIITPDTMAVGCAGVGTRDCRLRYGKVGELLNYDFGHELHCLIVPGELHFIEKEMLETINE